MNLESDDSDDDQEVDNDNYNDNDNDNDNDSKDDMRDADPATTEAFSNKDFLLKPRELEVNLYNKYIFF